MKISHFSLAFFSLFSLFGSLSAKLISYSAPLENIDIQDEWNNGGFNNYQLLADGDNFN